MNLERRSAVFPALGYSVFVSVFVSLVKTSPESADRSAVSLFLLHCY